MRKLKLANEKLLVEKEKLETELVIRVSEFSSLSNEKKQAKERKYTAETKDQCT